MALVLYMGKPGAGCTFDLPPGWMRQIIGASQSRSVAAQRSSRCCGTFWDSVRCCSVSIDLGRVNLTVPYVFRAASSEDESKNVLSWELGSLEEDAAQNAEIPFFTDSNFAVIAAKYPTKKKGLLLRRRVQYPTAPKGFLSPGSVVIPGQTPTGWNNPC